MFYLAVVQGYSVPDGSTSFQLKESRFSTTVDSGSLNIEAEGENQFKVSYALDTDSANLLKEPLFLSGSYNVIGSLMVRSVADTLLTNIPVSIRLPAPAE
jgi:hypothetical protein